MATASPQLLVRGVLARARELPDESLTCWNAQLASYRITMRFTNAEQGARFANRVVGAAPGALQRRDCTFDVLDTASLGWRSPAEWPFWYGNREQLQRQLAEERLGALVPDGAPDADFPFMFFDADTMHGVILATSGQQLPDWAAGAPFAYLFHLALAARGGRLLHAGTLGGKGGGALLVGDPGAGKSATTLSGVLAGLSSVGDDLVAVTLDPAPTAWPVYRNFKQSLGGLARFPDLAQKLADQPLNWRGKIEFDCGIARPGCMAPRLALHAILIPRVGHPGPSAIETAIPTTVFSLIARSLMLALPGARLAGFRFLTHLTRVLPGYWLRLADDPRDVGVCVRDMLDRVPS